MAEASKRPGYQIMVELEGAEDIDPKEIANELARSIVERQQAEGLAAAPQDFLQFIRVFLRVIIVR